MPATARQSGIERDRDKQRRRKKKRVRERQKEKEHRLRRQEKGEQGTFGTVGGNIFNLVEEKRGENKGAKKTLPGYHITEKEEEDEKEK